MIVSSSGLASGLLNAAVLALSARNGQTGEIATYAVVTAALTLVAVAVAGNSPLLYISGDAGQRRAVRSQWVFLTLPIMALGTLAVGAFYRRSGYEWPAMLAVGAVAMGNNLGRWSGACAAGRASAAPHPIDRRSWWPSSARR
ncbi:hypothetical protein [Micromonospora sp. L31]|uniref:hypothetical protein n=1 Tax=Micromonospora sp. L31 TaxID=3452213 RepID=UPI003F8A66E6